MGRKKARDNTFKCIYQLEFENRDIDRILKFCYEENKNEDYCLISHIQLPPR